MNVRYPAALVLTLAFTAGLPAHAAAPHSKHASRFTSPPRAGRLYSARALRQARIILQLKLLELRSEHLERVREAIQHRIPVDELLKM
ncbi:MAG TPA: hypothetical protein VGZ02_16120 [Candidatus Baltobacteraceae bacterium]|jgi:hypothetical protein|nr:hypothetical protein [Candidatus Baltobacteraceae bacterium]